MVVHQDKTYEQYWECPNINYTSDLNAAVIDETTPEGQQMAANVRAWFPYYEYKTDGKGNITEVTQIQKPEYENADEVNQAIIAKIRQKYSQDDEFKLINQGIIDAQDSDYLAYRQYVQECKDWGTQKKQELGL